MATDDPFIQFKITFFEECNELMANVEQYLEIIEAGRFDNETLHATFRAVHSIKAGASAFSFDRMVAFTHKFENLLDELRTEKLAVDQLMAETLFSGFDILADLVNYAQADTAPPEGFGQDVLDTIQAYLADSPEPIAVKSEAIDTLQQEVIQTQQHFHIEFTPKETMYQNANEPLLILRELKSLGDLTVHIDTSRLPPFESLQPENAYFSWIMDLWTEHDREHIEDVFEFVEGDCALSIVAVDDADGLPSADSQVIEDEDEDDFGFFGAVEGTPEAAVSEGESAELTSAVKRDAKPIEMQNADVASIKKTAPTLAQPATGGVEPAKVSSIRVDIDRVDRLVNMVGELVITQSMLAQEIDEITQNQTSRVATGMEELSMHIRELQENVMAIRMQPVKSVFSRMPRIVRDVSKKLGKKVKLVTVGEATEVDKTVIEELADPLTHMIRNSLDHGLEEPEERIAAGKEEEGTIRLSAEHRGGRIVIEIVDNGRGINRTKVLELAKEKGVVPHDVELSSEEIDNLIFAPGFSTAEEVTDLSGRGVGMDVVRRNIQSLGGRVSVQSQPGQGARFQLTLPLTLAVLDGMIVGVGSQRYVIPINSILETIRPTKEDLNELVGGAAVMKVRGHYIRIVPVGEVLAIEGAEQDPTKGLVVLVEADGGQIIGLLVDYLAGQQQVVIKSLETNFRAVEGIASATILGDGSVCLILDVDRLATMEVQAKPKLTKEKPLLIQVVG